MSILWQIAHRFSSKMYKKERKFHRYKFYAKKVSLYTLLDLFILPFFVVSDILAALCSRGRTIIEDDSTIAIHNYFDTKFKRINDEIMDIENAKTLSMAEPSLVIEKPTEESTISQKDPTLTTPQTKMVS